MGLRWDFDGPLSEKNGRLTAFNGAMYQYNAATDTITNSGLEVASNNTALGTLVLAIHCSRIFRAGSRRGSASRGARRKT
jgi:hypothetical protein